MGSPEQNLRRFSLVFVLARAYFWAPVFFLYLNARFPIERVLQLEAIYYLTVVALEVPSGYLSDRVGRVVTLRLAALAGVASYTLFLVGGEQFGVFVLAKMLLATFFSFLSGTETSFHLDALEEAGRADEYPGREARLHRRGFLMTAAGALVGGAAGAFDLRLAYALSLLGAAVMGALALGLREPVRHGAEDGVLLFGAQLRSCIARMRTPWLAWLFAYVVLQTTLEHVPYEFMQPYLALVLGEQAAQVQRTPLVAGLVVAAVAAVGAFAAGRAARLRERFGARATLLGITTVQAGLIAAMAWVVHPLVAGMLVLRSLQPAVGHVVVNAEVTPRVPPRERATYHSLHSLAGRVGYAAVLLGLAAVAPGGGEREPEALAEMLRWSTAIAVVGLALLALFRSRPSPA